MTGLLIAAAIILFFALILLIRVGIVIEYFGKDVRLTLRILGIPIKLLPKKKKKLRLSDYSSKALLKRQKKEAKKLRKKELKKEKKKPKPAEAHAEKEKTPIPEKISLITDLVKYLLGKFFGHLRIDLTRINITVGSEDAAKTAILFGIINQAALALLDVLSSITNVKKSRKSEMSVRADFTADKISCDISIAFSLRVWHAFALALGTVFRYIGRMIKKQK